MKNVKIEDSAFVTIKEYCNKNGLKIYSWVTNSLLKEISRCQKKEKKNTK